MPVVAVATYSFLTPLASHWRQQKKSSLTFLTFPWGCSFSSSSVNSHPCPYTQLERALPFLCKRPPRMKWRPDISKRGMSLILVCDGDPIRVAVSIRLAMACFCCRRAVIRLPVDGVEIAGSGINVSGDNWDAFDIVIEE